MAQPSIRFDIGDDDSPLPTHTGYLEGPGYPNLGQPAPGYPHPGQYQPQHHGQPIATQPAPVQHGHNPHIPPGLEYLKAVDQLLVHQKVELLEAFVGFETQNKYTIKNSMGQKVFYAVEDNDCCTRSCFGRIRPFDMKIMDHHKHEVIRLNRPLRCESCFCPCCLQELEVTSPPGTIIGYVQQEWSVCVPKFKILNAARDVVLRIDGPSCTIPCFGDVKFDVLSEDGKVKVGKITKQWTGLLKETFTDADHFGVTFPMDLDVKMKAVMLGACFLIDFMFFERTN